MISPERLQEIRDEHSISQDQQWCCDCDCSWPCDTIELLNAYDEMKAERAVLEAMWLELRDNYAETRIASVMDEIEGMHRG